MVDALMLFAAFICCVALQSITGLWSHGAYVVKQMCCSIHGLANTFMLITLFFIIFSIRKERSRTFECAKLPILGLCNIHWVMYVGLCSAWGFLLCCIKITAQGRECGSLPLPPLKRMIQLKN